MDILHLNKNKHQPKKDLNLYNSPFVYTSSWYLSRITTVNKRNIYFTYTDESYKGVTQESCLKYNPLSSTGMGNCGPGGEIVYSCSKTLIQYPTGGTAQFAYEANRYNPLPGTVIEHVTKSLTVYQYYSDGFYDDNRFCPFLVSKIDSRGTENPIYECYIPSELNGGCSHAYAVKQLMLSPGTCRFEASALAKDVWFSFSWEYDKECFLL